MTTNPAFATRRLQALSSIIVVSVTICRTTAPSMAAEAAVIPENVSHTVSTAAPPKTGLAFSADPTTREILRARVFEEPLVPIGGEPGAEENAALASALLGYANRSGPDDFASLTGFLEKHPQSPWRAALFTGLGLEYYNTAHYSLTLDAWREAWALAKNATDAKGKAIADRAAGELAYMYARLGRMTELEALLKSVADRVSVVPLGPQLDIATPAPGQATISWDPDTPGFVLQETLSMSPTNWLNSPSGPTNPITVLIPDDTRFYRLFKP